MIFHDHVNPLALTNRHQFHFEMSFIYLWLLTLNISCLICHFGIQNDWFHNIFRGIYSNFPKNPHRASADRILKFIVLAFLLKIHSFFFLPEYTFQTIIRLYEFMIFSRSFTLANCRFDSDY